MNNKEDKSYKELLKDITNEKQKLFLKYYQKYRNTVKTCEVIGIHEMTPYQWKYREGEGGVFNKAFLALKKEIQDLIIEQHEQNIDDIALNPNTPAQSRIFGSLVRLRAEAPDKYREKSQSPTLIGNVTIKMAIPDYEDEKPEIIDISPKELSSEDSSTSS